MAKECLTIAPVENKIDIFEAYDLLSYILNQQIYYAIHSISGKRKRGCYSGKRYTKRYVKKMSLVELIGVDRW